MPTRNLLFEAKENGCSTTKEGRTHDRVTYIIMVHEVAAVARGGGQRLSDEVAEGAVRVDGLQRHALGGELLPQVLLAVPQDAVAPPGHALLQPPAFV